MKARPRGSLERHLPERRKDRDELFLMRRAAWRQQGIMVVNPDDIPDELIRRVLIGVATELYGPPSERTPNAG